MQSGQFIWHELGAGDVQAALAFYGAVVGWTAEPVGDEGAYFRLSLDGRAVAGVRPLRDGADAAGWVGYVGVDDVDAVVSAAEGAGGTRLTPTVELPGLVRFASIGDPDGLRLVVAKGLSDGADASEPACPGRGTVCWNELVASDGQRSVGFLSGLFGWQRHRAMDMGPLGTYQIYGQGQMDFGGVMSAPPGCPTGWMFYFGIDDIDAAGARVEQAGGTVLRGPDEVPGGAWILQCRDGQGQIFGLVGGRAS